MFAGSTRGGAGRGGQSPLRFDTWKVRQLTDEVRAFSLALNQNLPDRVVEREELDRVDREGALDAKGLLERWPE